MTGQALQAPGRQLVFQAAAAMFFISRWRGKKNTNKGGNGRNNQTNTN